MALKVGATGTNRSACDQLTDEQCARGVSKKHLGGQGRRVPAVIFV